MSNNGWIGVDLDGTLAFYDTWKGVEHIGEPIPNMVSKVQQWVSEGHTVKIMTARVSVQKELAEPFIKEWCKKHIGFELEVTHQKDLGMTALYDDKAFHVSPNTGTIEADRIKELEAENARLKKALEISKEALEYIAYPLDSMHKKLKQGETLSDFAIYMAKDADYLKSIARDANNQLADVLRGKQIYPEVEG